MSTSKSTRSENNGYHHGNLREALLEEGMKLLEEEGEAGFSLRALARRVGVTPNAAYRHFDNKEALLMALAAEGYQMFNGAQVDAWEKAPGDAAGKFLATGKSYVHFARCHPALFRLMFGRFSAEHRSEVLDAAAWAAFTILRRGAAAAVGLPVDSDAALAAAYHAWAMVHGFSHLVLDGQIHGSEREIENAVESSLRRWVSSRE